MLQIQQYHQRNASKASTINIRRSFSSRCRGYVGSYRDFNVNLIILTVVLILIGVLLVPGSTLQSSSRTTQSHGGSLVHAWAAISLFKNNRHNRNQNGWKRQLQHPRQSPSGDIVVMIAKAESDNEDLTDSNLDDRNIDDDEFIETKEASPTMSNDNENMKLMEKVWRYNKKPLLSIGAQKGPTNKHGNSLRELLQHHTTVKVKTQLLFNASNRNSDAQSMQDQMVQVYHQLKEHAVNADPSLRDMELLQVRVNERILLVGLPGTKQRIIDGTYPPPPPSPPQSTIEDQTTATNI